MAEYRLTCRACGAKTAATRKDAKQCRSCRLLTVLVYVEKKRLGRRSCRACGSKFIPMRFGDYGHCGSCTATQKHSSPPDLVCGICRQPCHATEGVPVCLCCVKDPKQRPRVIAALKHGQATRRKKHADDWKAAAAGERPIKRVDQNSDTAAPRP